MDGWATVKNKWCKLHVDIRSNFKLGQVEWEARWAYICFLTMEADGTLDKNPSLTWLAQQCGMGYMDFSQAAHDLMDAGLLTKSYRVVNFSQRQYIDEKNAQRQKRYRDKQKALESYGNGDSDVTETVISNTSEAEAEAETESEAETKKNVTSRSPCPYAKIIAYLNTKAGSAFSEQAMSTRRLIKGRWDEGYTLEQFQTVIDDRVQAWANDGDMRQYLRPATLFNATKFESYLGGLSAGGPLGMQWKPKELR